MSIQTQAFNSPIQRVGIVRPYARKSEIVQEDDPANCVYEIISGAVCTCKTLREGRRQITGFYFPGDAFGLESAEKHNVDAQAITNAEVRVIKKQALTALAASNREVANQLLELKDWLASPEGKAATGFELTSFSWWGEVGRS